MKLNLKAILFHSIKTLIGLVFIFSAIAKLIAVDAFELYIFSLHWFTFNFSAVVARLMISTEMLLGILLIFQIHYKIVWRITFGLLLLFSGFLVFQILRGESENCQCFGELLKLNPVESLIKNSILLILLLTIRKEKPFRIQYASHIFLFAGVFSLCLPAVISRPDFLMDWSDPGALTMETISERIKENDVLDTLQLENKKQLLCFFSVNCPYCKHAVNKISVIADKYQLQNSITCVFTGDESLLNTFWEEGNSQPFQYTFLPLKQFFFIAGPVVPSIYLIDHGKVVKQYNYRSINEKEIREFLEEEG